MATKQTNIRIEVELLAKYESLAKSNDRPTSYYYHKALESFDLIQDEPKPIPVSVASMPVKVKSRKIPTIKDDVLYSDTDRVIDYLNLKIAGIGGKKYQYKAASRDPIFKILTEYSVNDCIAVIDKKWKEWIGTDMAKYLRPSTLFRLSKFEGYLNQITVKESGGCNDILNDTSWADDIYTGIGQQGNGGFAGELPGLEKLIDNEGSHGRVYNELPPSIARSDDREQRQFGFDDKGGNGQGPCD